MYVANLIYFIFHYRIIWFVMIIFFTYCALQLGLIQLNRYNINPTVVSLRKDFRKWTRIFPAVTICPDNKINFERAKEYIHR